MAGTPAPATPVITGRRDRTHFLDIAVVVAVVAGVVVGLVAPDIAEQVKPLGTAFMALTTTMIIPVACTIVLAIGSVRQFAEVGRLGGALPRTLPRQLDRGAGHGARRGQPDPSRRRPEPRQRRKACRRQFRRRNLAGEFDGDQACAVPSGERLYDQETLPAGDGPDSPVGGSPADGSCVPAPSVRSSPARGPLDGGSPVPGLSAQPGGVPAPPRLLPRLLEPVNA